MLPYTLRQLVWMLTSALQLIYALSTGIVWVLQMLRLFAYGACVGVCFIPHWWWYLTSPNIIRRVSYRSSDTTKRRNILRVLEAEGVDLHEVLRKSAAPPPLPLPGGLRRRRLLAGPRPHSEGSTTSSQTRLTPITEEAGGSGHRSSGVALQRGGRPVPPRRRPLSNVATVAASRDGQWEASDAYGAGGGEVVEAAAPLAHRRDIFSRAQSSTLSALQLRPSSLDYPGEEEMDAHSAVGPLVKHTLRRRGGGSGGRHANDTPTSTTLERLMGAAPVHLNPADGSALRSLPVQRHPTTKAGGRGSARGPEDTRAVPRRLHNSVSPQRTPPTTFKAAALAGELGGGVAKQSSSSSCDMTVNRPENSSGEEDRGVGGNGSGKTAAPASSTPQLRSTAAPPMAADGIQSEGAVPVFEGRPVYYNALPTVELPNDPLLKDVLAALQEGDYGDDGDDDARGVGNVDGVPADFDATDAQLACGTPRSEGYHHTSPPPRRGQGGCAAPRQPVRRSPHPSQRRPRASPQSQAGRPTPPPPQHTRSFSEENILAGLEEEDEEDKMNLHNRATVDIVLPVPLDSLMKTLEYTQHSKRLRRKRFPIIINVTGAVWIIGSHLWSTMMARILAQRGYVVFCPDYRNFPQTTMEGMTLDVSDAVAWVLNNAERYNGDLNNVTLIGQSAGAHLTMMSLLSQAHLSAYRSNTMHGTYEGEPPPSDVAYNVPRYNPRESIHRYVGLSGMYNIEGLVDHFQREGLNTPVLHQIAGGRDQLPRYSIHAYFDDRRGGDTGEVLPDNIFDYFPQRMFFVHGDADKCAPVTESASLVAMLRSAQERFALRRSERNEEARRHALRSRRLLPGARTAGGSTTHRGEGVGEDVAHGGAHRGGTASAWGQRCAGEEDGNSRHAAGERADDDGCGGRQLAGPSILKGDSGARRSTFEASFSVSGGGPQQQQQQQVSAAMISPIVPPSRHDQPRSPVELEFIVIPHGRHSDAFVDECIAAGRSCCVDFLCDYESAVDCPSSSFSNSSAHGMDGDSLCGSVRDFASPGHRGDRVPAWMAHSTQVCAMPDGILPLAVPTEERSLPLRLCTLICPF